MNYNYDGSDYYNKNEYVYDEINDSKPPKKKMPFGKVLILVMTFALMFGVGAGGGYYFFSTLGDNNKEADSNVVNKVNFVGKNLFWIPKVGYVVKAFQTTKGKIVAGAIIVLLFVSGFLFGDDKKKEKLSK